MLVYILKEGRSRICSEYQFPSGWSCIELMCDSPCGYHAAIADFMLSDGTLGLILH